MSSSQYTSSLRAAAAVEYIVDGPARLPVFVTNADGSKNVRGFASVARVAGVPAGSLELAPDDINGFSPTEDTIEITPRLAFDAAASTNVPRIYCEFLAADPVTGKRKIRVNTSLWDSIGEAQSLADIGFDIKVRTVRLPEQSS